MDQTPAKIEALCPVEAVANHFISCSRKSKIGVTNLAMQKLVYIAYGWTWAFREKKLFPDRIEAWPLGPVIPTLYHQLKINGRDNITQKITDYNYDKDEFFVWNINHEKDPKLVMILDWVWRGYKPENTSWLVTLTHNDGTPWKKTVEQHGYGHVIADELIRGHFAELHNNLIELTKKQAQQ